MIVAITGANGFIGQHLVRRFTEAGWEARGLARRDIELGRLAELLTSANVVVHAAGETRAPTVERLRQSNVTLTAELLEASRAAAVQRFVFISSLAACGPAASREKPVSEATPAAPIEAYGQSKLDAEQLVGASGIPNVIVRPSAVYGPSDRDFLALFRVARRGLAIHPGNREHWMSIIHVSDLADAILCSAVAPEAAGRIYCLANDEPVQWADLFQAAATCAGRRLAADINVPGSLVDLGARLGDVVARVTGRASLLTTQKVALSKPRYWVCSSELAARELGIRPRVPLQQGFCETYRWYLEHGWL